MKKTLIFAAAALAVGCGNPNRFVIEGQAEELAGTLYLFDQENRITDSAAVEAGAFRFEGQAAQPALAYLSDSRTNGPSTFATLLILEPGTIRVARNAGQSDRLTVSGTPANDANTAYNAAAQALVQEFYAEETDDARREAIEEEYNALARKSMEDNRTNLFGALLLAQQLGYELSGQELLDEIALFSPELQQSDVLAKLKTSAEQKMKTDVGQPFIDVVQPTAEGEPLALSAVIARPENKYTLLDFWASWCGPCMGEVPHLIRTYDDFHAKGFEIYGVSFDNDRTKWLDAVKQKGMKWLHVSELKGFENQAREDYSIQGIPSNFLIDSEGRIVASNLRGEALYAKIEELLGE